MQKLDDIKRWMGMPCVGSVETGAASWWRLALDLIPNVRVATLRRPIDEVMDSWARSGVAFDAKIMRSACERIDRKLDQIEARIPNVVRFDFDSLSMIDGRKTLFTWATEGEFNEAWDTLHVEMNLQINLHAEIRKWKAMAECKKHIEDSAKVTSFDLLGKKKKISNLGGMDFEEKNLDELDSDFYSFLDKKFILIGEDSESSKMMNWDLWKSLEKERRSQIILAKSNGRIFGYLFSFVGANPRDSSILEATHTGFGVDSHAPKGTGTSLMRFANERLKLKGINRVFMRIGTRGDTHKLLSMYKRMGAEYQGEWYSLNLQ